MLLRKKEVETLEQKAFIVWHYYEDGKLVDYSITSFTGSDSDLDDCLRNDAFREPRNNGKKEGERIVILHQVILL